jgi:thiosulfate dehydrogenase [quinone] large subunit
VLRERRRKDDGRHGHQRHDSDRTDSDLHDFRLTAPRGKTGRLGSLAVRRRPSIRPLDATTAISGGTHLQADGAGNHFGIPATDCVVSPMPSLRTIAKIGREKDSRAAIQWRVQMSATKSVADAAIGSTTSVAATPSARSEVRVLSRETALRYLWAATRLSMGWVFLWPFLDKMFGLGHETSSANAWINGGNPTKGFLSGSIGPVSVIYQNIAGATWLNWLFMFGLIAIAVGLLLGTFMRLACAGGALLVVLMWSASLPPADDVFMDNHIIYALLLAGLALVGAGNTLGFGHWWTRTSLVQRFAWLA